MRRQLPTSALYILPAALPDRGVHPFVEENLPKAFNARARSWLKRRFRKGIERNEIHFGPQSVQQPHKPSGIFLAIIHSVEHGVREGNPLARRDR